MGIELKELREFRTLGERIALCRKSRGMSRRELAKMLDVSVSSIGHYERNESIPNPRILCELALIFNVSVNMFVFGYAPDGETLVSSDDNFAKDDFSETADRIVREKDGCMNLSKAKTLQEKLTEIRYANGSMPID